MIPPSLIHKQRLILLGLFLFIIISIIIALGTGYAALSYDRLIPTFLGQGTFKENFILYSIRMPRILITLLSGMALALSGSILQGVTQNDLADPGIIGINAGAGVAISIFYLYFPIDAGAFTYMIPIVAFVGAGISAALIYLFSVDKQTGIHPVRLILTGVGFSLALSGIMVVLISSAEREKVNFISKWLSGNIWGTDWPFIWALLPWLIIFIPFALYKANKLNLLGLSESVALGVGVSVEKERLQLLIAAVALAASAVSVTGGISFVGLMAPHIAKAFVGPRHQLFMPIAILLGGLLLLIADTIGRNINTAEGIPAGVVVALIGAPYFVYLLLKK